MKVNDMIMKKLCSLNNLFSVPQSVCIPRTYRKDQIKLKIQISENKCFMSDGQMYLTGIANTTRYAEI